MPISGRLVKTRIIEECGVYAFDCHTFSSDIDGPISTIVSCNEMSVGTRKGSIASKVNGIWSTIRQLAL